MPFMIYTVDGPDGKSIRAKHLAAHFEYLDKHQEKLLASGGTFDDEMKAACGSCILVNVDSREEAQAFVDGDPFHQAGLAQTIVITRWKAAYFDGKRLRPPVAT